MATNQVSTETNCACDCGETRFAVRGRPLLRAFCHCTICQSFNEKPQADISVFRPAGVERPAEDLVDFQTYRPPPAVQRGKCMACDRPAIEYLNLPAVPELVIIPTANIRESMFVIDPQLHIFYHRRIADADDDLPKYTGYLRSELAFGRRVVAAMLGRGGRGGRG